MAGRTIQWLEWSDYVIRIWTLMTKKMTNHWKYYWIWYIKYQDKFDFLKRKVLFPETLNLLWKAVQVLWNAVQLRTGLSLTDFDGMLSSHWRIEMTQLGM